MLKHRKNKKVIFITLILLLAVVGAGGALYKNHIDSKNVSVNRPPNSVDYSGPTKEEATSGDEQKKANQEREKFDSNTTPATTASVFISDSSQYDNIIEIRSYVSNVFENGGTCEAVLTNGASTVTESSSAFKDATTTQCGTITIARSKFPTAGTWKLSLNYTSPTASGKANADVVIK